MTYEPLDFSRLRSISLAQRESKVRTEAFARPARAGATFREFVASLPDILAGQDFRAVVDAIVRARRNRRPIVFAMGAHIIKCGLSPVVIDLMERGLITAVAMNGAGPIHDVEIALVGHTSEDVQAGLRDGAFGMARETGEVIHDALAGVGPDVGLGAAVGRRLLALDPPHGKSSILAAAARLGVPATVHVAVGTDIVHMRAGASGAEIGRASFTDFRLLASVVADLSGGVYLNVGSAVILPEVFLKAFTIAQNLGAALHDFTTVNIDMLVHYRPSVNVVQRPASVGGRGYSLTGRHELLIPLLAFAVVEALEVSGG
jgi:deoxyhypusine synthase